jgi:hypothetical protein
MENKYTDDDWVEIRDIFTVGSLLATIVNYRKMYAIPNEHQRLFEKSLIDHILEEGQQESVVGKALKNIYDVIFGPLKYVPLFINSYPDIVGWRLAHGK